MPESNEAALALIIDRLQAIDRQIGHEQKNSAMSRQRLYDKLEALEKQQDRTDGRLERVEASLLSMSPTVQEFVNMKAKAQVAGRLGSLLWKTGSVLLSVAAGAAAMWAYFWSYFQWR